MAKDKKRREVVIAGNWKMYKNRNEAMHFIETLAPLVKESQVLIYLSVPFTAIASCVELVKKLDSSIMIGAQNMHDAKEGAFTGEIAAEMLKDVGASFVILGHSERRLHFGESNEFINKKVHKALESGLRPILCVGETLEERERMKTILEEQISKSLADLSADMIKPLILAYEPVWAVGTGKVACPSEAEEAHAFCRKVLSEQFGDEIASMLPILYGGSVKPENSAVLLEENDIDGLLVGGASLSAEVFNQIIHFNIRVES
ncbi:MAG: triose-phosphate isomerase [Chlamydiia bacterium]|nr:triose-phosphate isomerase [Chlamydiia bacterium]